MKVRPDLPSEVRFMQACKRCVPADELDGFVVEMRRDQRLVRDVARISELVLGEMGDAADEVAGLLQRARYLLEGAP